MRNIDLFAFHPRSWRQNRYVYPVLSRRSRGLSIGINLNPDKICNFDCVYCCVDRTLPTPREEVDLDILQLELREMLALALSGQIFNDPAFQQTPPEYRRVNDVAFSGDGEPTASPVFADAVDLVARELQLAGRPAGSPKIVLITNATLLTRPPVARALDLLAHHAGEIWAKLDAGTETYYQQINRTAVPLTHVLENIRITGRRHPLTIQSLFLRHQGQRPSPYEIDAYTHRLQSLRAGGCQLQSVQVYTIARKPAQTSPRNPARNPTDPSVPPLEPAELDAITAHLRQHHLPAESFYGVG